MLLQSMLTPECNHCLEHQRPSHSAPQDPKWLQRMLSYAAQERSAAVFRAVLQRFTMLGTKALLGPLLKNVFNRYARYAQTGLQYGWYATWPAAGASLACMCSACL